MTHIPTPPRAPLADVPNALRDSTAAVLLSALIDATDSPLEALTAIPTFRYRRASSRNS
ncbi:hypothetical protein, partial [Pseudomonas aeruginosa]|uniref:hypothetical protein n=1 Tax=Pseudomonas aeruginosa TaxID=287 RepID=UPI0034D97882